ncbi:hypothetical protein [Isoalcanivorax indicus]|uniref:hypothetical protein n=1 Tax=Isoalcanivorax indicus TaxID=2202653 RepID=UPI0013C3EDA3|nr:hypothetical protein [Isoalcanivorax indicus]
MPNHSLNNVQPFPGSSSFPEASLTPQEMATIDDWLDAHATPVDIDGHVVSSPLLSDDVVAYRIDGVLVCARSSASMLGRMALQLAGRYHLGDDSIRLLTAALLTLRAELCQQPHQL